MHTTTQFLETLSLESLPTAVPPLLAERADKVSEGLSLLVEAREFATHLHRNVWDFAVELSALQAAGLTTSEIRCMVCMGYVTHNREQVGATTDGTRRFCEEGLLTLCEHSCFVLTDEGVEALKTLNALTCSKQSTIGRDASGSDIPLTEPFIPLWDAERQELRVGGRLVKQFKLPSPNQEMVLLSFQEEGWPVRIDDPLPPVADILPKRRLHDTIKSLNRSQKCRLIRFLGDGSGEGVRWEIRWPAPTGDLRA